MKKIAIIGSGFGGLASAALLAKIGFKVTVYEKNSLPGGRAMYFQEGDYKFDMGPSWYMMPEVFEKYFSQFDRKPSDFYQLSRLNPTYRAFHNQGYHDISADYDKLSNLFDQLEPNSSRSLDKLIKLAKLLYEQSMHRFIYKDFTSIWDFVDLKFGFEFITKRLFVSYDKLIKKNIYHPLLQKLLLWHTVFLGGTPKNVPALYVLMIYVDIILGTYYPQGGMYEVVKAFKELGEEWGVEYNFNSEVDEISIKNGKAVGVVVDGQFHQADIILANADYHHVEQNLIPEGYRSYSEQYWSSRQMSPATYLLFLGLNCKLNKLLHHNYYFSEQWDQHFSCIIDKPSWPPDYSFYISCRSKSDPSVAPEGGENLMILIPVAPGLEDSEQIRKKYSQQLIYKLEKLTGINISNHIEVMKISTHRDQIAQYHAFQGNSFGLANTLWQTGSFRPGNQSAKVKNLFFVGTHTVPGIGMPLSVISAQVISQKIGKIYGSEITGN